MVIKFNEAGRVRWVFGRRQESADAVKPWEHVDPPLLAGAEDRPAVDACGAVGR